MRAVRPTSPAYFSVATGLARAPMIISGEVAGPRRQERWTLSRRHRRSN
jgi:hypothetical protein